MCGVACITSKIAFRTRSARTLRVAHMPKARPIAAATGTVTTTIAKVCMASDHRPKTAR